MTNGPDLPPAGDENGQASPALSGDLARFRVHDLCQLLGLSQATGRLYLRAPGVHGVIEVEHGGVVGAAIRPNPERIGRILRQSGAVSLPALDLALAQKIAGDQRPLGEILVESQVIAGETLERALAEQHRAALQALLVLPAGRFAFKPGPPTGRARYRFDFDGLLLEALTRLDELDSNRIPPE
jgi:hypothetical protein